MKKSYFVTWLGTLSTFFLVLASAGRKAKKYGQAVHPKQKKKLSFEKTAGLLNKGLDFAMKKFVKQ